MLPKFGSLAKAVPPQVSREQLAEALAKYRQQALEWGAADAMVIPSEMVKVDERVRFKCLVPRCFRVGESPNCPPYTPPPEEVRRALSQYQQAVLVKTVLKPVSDYLASRGAAQGQRDKALSFHTETAKIVGEIEGLAFRDGFYLALGLAGGSCKDYLCHGQVCQFLDSGRCRFPLRARPSMEALGIDVFDLCNRVGWPVYPLCHQEQEPEAIPYGISVGIVFIQ